MSTFIYATVNATHEGSSVCYARNWMSTFVCVCFYLFLPGDLSAHCYTTCVCAHKGKKAICVYFSLIYICLQGGVYSRLAGGLRPVPAPLVCTDTRCNLFHDVSSSTHTHSHTCIHTDAYIHTHTGLRGGSQLSATRNHQCYHLHSPLASSCLCVCVCVLTLVFES